MQHGTGPAAIIELRAFQLTSASELPVKRDPGEVALQCTPLLSLHASRRCGNLEEIY
jgi:hypothetical protein